MTSLKYTPPMCSSPAFTIKETRPTDGVQYLYNLKDGILFEQPKTADARADIAGVCMLRHNFSFPMVLDDMTDDAMSKYAAIPEHLYVLDSEGHIIYKRGSSVLPVSSVVQTLQGAQPLT